MKTILLMTILVQGKKEKKYGFESGTDLFRHYISANSQEWMNKLFLNKEEAPKWDFDFLNTRRQFLKFELLNRFSFIYKGELHYFYKAKFYNNPVIPLEIRYYKMKDINGRMYFIEQMEDENLLLIYDWYTKMRKDILNLFIEQPIIINEVEIEKASPVVKEMLQYCKMDFQFNIHRFLERIRTWETNGQQEKIYEFYNDK